ncbi:hypothetical protein Tco_0940997 [Tanacetum coccineum]|uniref:Reverse transcriptase Ty1/copia-type domain-containing protein n=1 Tax=Tanacetum coccineum TaxID=301880 RepID=A0ABQ5DRW7_9ASTR
MKTPMSSDTKLTKDEEYESVDSTKYRGMIGSLLYLTVSRPDIMFSVCLCARFQEAPKAFHLEEVKRIFRYIKGTTHLGLWYPKGTGIETVVYADSDHKQTALAISTTEAEYVSAGKACQQALWMKQALIDYDRAGEDLQQESTKKQKIDDNKEKEELKQCFEIVSDDGDDVTIDATPLSVKIPIVDYKIYQEGKKSFFQIIKADGKTQMYLTFSKMLKNFDREDLEVFWRIVKARFKKTKLVIYMDTFLHLNLKTMFEHHVEDSIWKNQQGLVKVLNWKLFYSCGVHCVTVQTIPYYLLVEKMYPLTKHTLYQMFNNVKLQVDYESEMAYELLRFVKKQLKEGYVPE